MTARALTKLATIKAELGISSGSSDEILTRMILSVSEAFERSTHRTLSYDADIEENVAGLGTTRLLIERTPVTSITSVELLDLDGTVSSLYDADTYEIEDAGAGTLYRAAGWVGLSSSAPTIREEALRGAERRAIKVTYIGGYITPDQDPASGTRDLPYDIEEAVISAVTTLWLRRGDDRSIHAEKLGDYAVTYGKGTGAGVLNSFAASVARRYRRVF